MNNKIIMLFTVCVSIPCFGGMDHWQTTKTAFGILGALAVASAPRKMKKSPIAVGLADYTGLDASDVGVALAVPIVLVGFRDVPGYTEYLDHAAGRALPLLGGFYFAQTKFMKNATACIGMDCENEKCTGLCKRCFCRTGLVTIATLFMFDRAMSAVGTSLSNSGWNRLGYIMGSLESKYE